ncbi:DUF1501 domain-containing protein [Mycobacterium sp. NPDC048908]|uniref:DUF1501 domain-containing protein n=1 Tax=Mycobacterium sp. NPDC048908 TaxID=3364292 RepID=UPI00372128AB
MPEFDRRKFLIASAGAGAVGLLGGVGALTLPDLLRHGQRQPPLAAGSGILVIVTLYGGNDGLSTLIPYADKAYHDARPELAYSPEEVLRLDGQLGLNPALEGLHSLWTDNELAIVRGVGYPEHDRSHFRSMDIWQTASPNEPVKTGWIGRWLDATGDDPLRAVNIGAVLAPLGIGEKHVAAALSDWVPQLPGDLATTLAAMSADDPRDTTAMAAVCEAYRANSQTAPQFARVVNGTTPSAKTTGSGNAQTLAADLELVATCIKAGVPSRVYLVSLGDFDTHADERGAHQSLLKALDDGLTAFMQHMRTSSFGRNVVVMAYSEFGRRVAANASAGTDHGTSGPVLLAGAHVKGGLYGDEPSLTDLDDGDLKTTTDFRDIYHELLGKTLHTDPEGVLGAGRRELGFL